MPKQRVDHDTAGHIPFRALCRACVAGRGRSDSHEIDLGTTGPEQVLAPTCTWGPCPGGREAAAIRGRHYEVRKAVTADIVLANEAAQPLSVAALTRAILTMELRHHLAARQQAGHPRPQAACNRRVPDKARDDSDT